MNYLSQYYKNLSEQLQEKIKNLEYLLEYAPVAPPTESGEQKLARMKKELQDALDGKPVQQSSPTSTRPVPVSQPTATQGPPRTPPKPSEKEDSDVYTAKNGDERVAITSFRKIYTKRYGDKLGQILSDIEQKRASMPQDLLKQIDQTYNIPSYKPEDIDRKISVMKSGMVHPGAVGEARPGGHHIYLNKDSPDTQTRIDDVKLERKPTLKVGFSLLGDVIGHEGTHIVQDKQRAEANNFPLNSNKRQTDIGGNFDVHTLTPQEWPAYASGLKYYHHEKTGKYIGANASDKDIDDMIDSWEMERESNPEGYYPAEDNVIKSLNDKDPQKKKINREAFKLITKDNDKNTDTRMS